MASVFKRCPCAKGLSDEKKKIRVWKKCDHSATVQWRNGGRGSKLQTLTFKKKDYDGDHWGAANRWAAKVEGAHAVQEVVKAPRRKGRSFQEAAEKFLEQRVGPDSTTISYRSNLRTHIYGFDLGGTSFGSLQETEVTREHVKSLVAGKIEEGYAANTVASIYIAVAAVFKDLKASKIVESSPCAGVQLPEHVESRVFVSPTLEQVDILASRIFEPWQIAVYLGYAGGLRIGESLAVRRDQIIETDEGAVLRINRQVKDVNTLVPLKRRKAHQYRDIPVTDYLREKLADHIARYSTPETGQLCPGKLGLYANLTMFYQDFRDGVGAAELPDEFTFHWLRHAFASRAIQDAQLSLPQVAKILGHRNSATTERVYWHLLQGSTSNAIKVLNRTFTKQGYKVMAA
ncbi:tyrosine-type recombinase/integrase [Nocardiopsis exhalans]|uniref:Tyrosine-type recombinase/integrase n=1 Tax=Nocardiopsis exhalans TaxID=163604 RepID=A0ABY5DDZ6_9ACTN|nr:tyrosine-type recombinase/integrase [Nocardiopsis exhalans]USY21708.1 tyrosine-type recombinase/integrase [Nocardiopsis exhalans]